MKLCVSSVLLDTWAEIQLLAGMEGLAFSRECIMCQVFWWSGDCAKNEPAKGAETRRKMSHARSRGMTERWPVELTVCTAFFVRLCETLVENHPWCLSRVSVWIRDRNGSRPCIFLSSAEFLSEFSAILRACFSTSYCGVLLLQPQSHLSAWMLAVIQSSKSSSDSHDIFSFHCTPQ